MTGAQILIQCNIVCRFPALQHLDISACRRVSDEELANLPKMPNLRSVVLSGCEDISDEGLTHLAHITKLTALNLSNCCKVSLELLLCSGTYLSVCSLHHRCLPSPAYDARYFSCAKVS